METDELIVLYTKGIDVSKINDTNDFCLSPKYDPERKTIKSVSRVA